MARKKKMNVAQKMRARLEREAADRDSHDFALSLLECAALSDAAALTGVDSSTPGELIPDEAMDNYVEAYQWAAEVPEAAKLLLAMTEQDWASVMVGIADPAHFGFPPDQVVGQAWKFRAWHILNGFKYTLDWPEPVATMSVAQIVAQISQDAVVGKTPMGRDLPKE